MHDEIKRQFEGMTEVQKTRSAQLYIKRFPEFFEPLPLIAGILTEENDALGLYLMLELLEVVFIDALHKVKKPGENGSSYELGDILQGL